MSYGYENMPLKERFKIPTEPDGFKYVVAEIPGPNDEGSSPIDHLDDLGYEICGQMSRRKVAMRIPIEKAQEIERLAQEKSRRNASMPLAPVDDGGKPIEGVVANTVEDLLPTTADQFLATKDKDGD